MHGACTGTHARPCTAAHAGGVRRRLRGLEGEKGDVYGNTLGALGCVPVHVWACTGVYAFVRRRTLAPGRAGLSYKLFPREGPCS